MSQGISLFRGLGSFLSNEKSINRLSDRLVPSLKLRADKEVYRPGDFVHVTIKIVNPGLINEGPRLLVDKLTFEMKGIEKFDVQWFAKQAPLPGSRQKRGIWMTFLKVSEQGVCDALYPGMDNIPPMAIAAIIDEFVEQATALQYHLCHKKIKK